MYTDSQDVCKKYITKVSVIVEAFPTTFDWVFVLQAVGCGIVESILNWVKFKAQNQLNKKCSAVKHSKIKGVPKLDDANDAGKCFISFVTNSFKYS